MIAAAAVDVLRLSLLVWSGLLILLACCAVLYCAGVQASLAADRTALYSQP
jgi:hypothetical protein